MQRDGTHCLDMETHESGVVGVIVAHPDDETLWAGGALLMHPHWRCRIYTLCRAGDPDRSAKFARVLAAFGAQGGMADLDDGPAQHPLPAAEVEQAILRLTGDTAFDLLFTHGPDGEYTCHQRHIETSRAVRALWAAGRIRARRLCLFAYEDGGRAYLPRARHDAACRTTLPPDIFARKYRLICDTYGFSPDSWEARATPATEAFWCFPSPAAMASRREGMEERS